MMMPRYRSRMALRPINRIKHVVDSSAILAKGTVLPDNIVIADDAPIIASTRKVITGSKVYGVYLKVLVASNDVFDAGAIPNVYLMVFKNPGGNLTFPAPNAVGVDDNKKYVIHQEMSMITNAQGAAPTVLFDGVIKIPKNYQRFGPSDTLTLAVLAPLLDIAFCYQAHFKEFR